jgi:hypothetical protein
MRLHAREFGCFLSLTFAVVVTFTYLQKSTRSFTSYAPTLGLQDTMAGRHVERRHRGDTVSNLDGPQSFQDYVPRCGP